MRTEFLQHEIDAALMAKQNEECFRTAYVQA
jgi:hypothetical protein